MQCLFVISDEAEWIEKRGSKQGGEGGRGEADVSSAVPEAMVGILAV